MNVLYDLKKQAHYEASLVWGDFNTTGKRGQMYRFIQRHYPAKGHIALLTENELRDLIRKLRKLQAKMKW